MRVLLALVVLVGCLGSDELYRQRAPHQPICAESVEGRVVNGCRCLWSEDWGSAWVTLQPDGGTANGYRGAEDWCPR